MSKSPHPRAEGGTAAEGLRAVVDRSISDQPLRKGGILAASPLVGADLDLSRPSSRGVTSIPDVVVSSTATSASA